MISNICKFCSPSILVIRLNERFKFLSLTNLLKFSMTLTWFCLKFNSNKLPRLWRFWMTLIWLMERSSSCSFGRLDRRNGWIYLIKLSESVNSVRFGQSMLPSMLAILFMLRFRSWRPMNLFLSSCTSAWAIEAKSSFLTSMVLTRCWFSASPASMFISMAYWKAESENSIFLEGIFRLTGWSSFRKVARVVGTRWCVSSRDWFRSWAIFWWQLYSTWLWMWCFLAYSGPCPPWPLFCKSSNCGAWVKQDGLPSSSNYPFSLDCLIVSKFRCNLSLLVFSISYGLFYC